MWIIRLSVRAWRIFLLDMAIRAYPRRKPGSRRVSEAIAAVKRLDQ